MRDLYEGHRVSFVKGERVVPHCEDQDAVLFKQKYRVALILAQDPKRFIGSGLKYIARRSDCSCGFQ